MPTYVLISRHAKPVDSGAEDDQRPLSDEGIDAQRKLANLLKKEKIKPDIIYTSPLIRAKQSAQILAEMLLSYVVEENALGKDFNPNRLLDLIPNPQENTATVIMVGHAPTLERFIHQLTKENSLPEGLAKSSAALIEFKKKIAFGSGKYLKIFNS